MTIRPEDLSDEHLNQRRRFAGLSPMDATELARLRGFLRWMRSRFAPDPDPRPNSDLADATVGAAEKGTRLCKIKI